MKTRDKKLNMLYNNNIERFMIITFFTSQFFIMYIIQWKFYKQKLNNCYFTNIVKFLLFFMYNATQAKLHDMVNISLF